MIVDEVHAVAGTKRGAHMAVSLDRLDELLERPAQRIGLSATVRPIEEVAPSSAASGRSRWSRRRRRRRGTSSVDRPRRGHDAELGQPTGELEGGPAAAAEPA